ncbi:MAG: hypothetical protein JO236_00720 [Mycobacterium sp.]|uniref:hypothetical protein n=1 Tax=Mycobacterium sp. TaxID=1785 RepID=UPI001ED630BF|nr:hypothetical protein [Mycobacterium sp.]MBW0016064.1 hypothetical protein [Mycobacterium sp.]
MKTFKSIAVGAAAVAAIGAAAAGVTSIASAVPVSAQVQPVVFGAPLPQDPVPAANVPTAGQLTTLLNSLADPSVPFANKSNLIEGGISGTEAHMADHEFKKAAKNGDLPLAFNVTNIQPSANGGATADVAVSGPKLNPPVTQSVTFVNQGSWILSRASALELLQAAGGH